MSDPFENQTIPRRAILSLGALVVLTLILVAFVQVTGRGKFVAAAAPVAEVRELLFQDRDEGGVAVIDAATQETVRILQPGEDGFIRATVRTMAQERMRLGLNTSTPFQLKQHTDGRISFEDPATRRVVSLEAFGSTNRAAFARLLAPTNS